MVIVEILSHGFAKEEKPLHSVWQIRLIVLCLCVCAPPTPGWIDGCISWIPLLNLQTHLKRS